MLKLILLVYVNDMVLLADNERDNIQISLNVIFVYSMFKYRTTKIKEFHKGKRVTKDLQFKYGDHVIDVIHRFCYLGIGVCLFFFGFFKTGGTFQEM